MKEGFEEVFIEGEEDFLVVLEVCQDLDKLNSMNPSQALVNCCID
jgi:hypothetical protein